MQDLYFGINNDFESKPQNEANTGFNEWDLIKYMPDRDNKGLLAALGIDNTTEWSYSDMVAQVSSLPELTADVDTDGVYSNLQYAIDGVQDDLTETIRIKKGKYCKNPIYVAWVNELGGMEYELFSKKQDEGFNIDGGNTVASNIDILESSNKREFTIGATTRKTLNCYKWNILLSQKNRFIDFKKSISERDILVLNKIFRADILSISDYSSTISGTILLEIENHGQENGDQIIIQLTTNYNGTYDVIKIDDNNIAVIASYIANETGRMQRIMKETDWLRCQAVDKSDAINNDNPVFNIEFEILLPTGT